MMKSLSDNYISSHGNSHETFTDLVFCTLVVLVLFVLALAVEVSHKHRYLSEGALAAEEIDAMTNDEIASLMQELGEQKVRIKEAQASLESSEAKLAEQKAFYDRQMAQLAGQHRFTGSREPATMHLAYDHRFDRFYFLPALKVTNALRSNSEESSWEFDKRKQAEFRTIANAAKSQRSYTLDEARDIYSSFSQYQIVTGVDDSFVSETEQIAITYVLALCSAISGDGQLPPEAAARIQQRMRQVVTRPGKPCDTLYPVCSLSVASNAVSKHAIKLSDTELRPVDARTILLALEGRPAIIQVEGLEGPTPNWLVNRVLNPTGHILKSPWLPELHESALLQASSR
jgi:hypothetical protein